MLALKVSWRKLIAAQDQVIGPEKTGPFQTANTGKQWPQAQRNTTQGLPVGAASPRNTSGQGIEDPEILDPPPCFRDKETGPQLGEMTMPKVTESIHGGTKAKGQVPIDILRTVTALQASSDGNLLSNMDTFSDLSLKVADLSILRPLYNKPEARASALRK